MTSRVLVSLRVPCSPAKAFALFTLEIGVWWADSSMFRFTPRSPGKLAFEPPDADGEGGRLVERLPNGKVFEVGPVRAWAPGERLAFSWRQATFTPEQVTHVEVRFEPVGDETRVTVEHRGWDAIPQEHVARHGFPLQVFQMRQGEHWRALLSAMSVVATKR